MLFIFQQPLIRTNQNGSCSLPSTFNYNLKELYLKMGGDTPECVLMVQSIIPLYGQVAYILLLTAR